MPTQKLYKGRCNKYLQIPFKGGYSKNIQKPVEEEWKRKENE
jgi:hypothetical protein